MSSIWFTDVVCFTYQVPEKEFSQFLGKTLTNSNDWEGFRLKRLIKSKENSGHSEDQQHVTAAPPA